MSVDQSGGLRMEIGVLHLSHAMLVLAELIVCSMGGLHASWLSGFGLLKLVSPLHMEVPRPHVISGPTYLGRRSASLMKEFWTLCIFVMTVSETVMVETIPYSNIGLTHCL